LDLKKNGKCIPMDEVLNKIKSKTVFDDYSFAISFDDGFYNNYKVAIPMLKKLNLSAIFYITTDFVDKNLSSWIDQIEYMVERVPSANLNTFWGKAGFNSSIISKIKFLNQVRKHVKKSKSIDPYKFASWIAKELKFKGNYKYLSHPMLKKMQWKHVKKIKNQKLFLIGGHSTKHRVLSSLKKIDVLSDLSKSIKIINKKLKIKLRHYSYPEGFRNSFGKREIKILKRNNIKICPAAEHGLNNHNTGLFYLKRIMVN